jgi:hypothetical protein
MSTVKPTLSSEELIRIIKAAGESENIDAKGPVAWDGSVESASLAKDIAAFANSRNGGVIVVGKKEESGKFDATGVTQDQAATFETTKVAQWVNTRFAPAIRLVCYQQEVDGKLFVVIEVLEFDDIPAICMKPFPDPNNSKNELLKKRTIYVRNANAASAPVETVEELRTLIGLATKKRSDEMFATFHAMLQGRPLVPLPTHEEQFQHELEEIETATTTERTKKGEWFFAFHPNSYNATRWQERDDLEGMIRKHSFRIVEEFPPCYKGTTGREWGIINTLYGPPWALTRSGLFVSRCPFREDDMQPIQAHLYVPTYGTNGLTLDSGKWTEYRWSLRAICEAFVFMSRMATEYDLGEMIEYQLAARPLSGRYLVMYQGFSSQFEIPNERGGPPEPCQAPMFCRKKSLSVEELRADWKSECVNAMKDFLELFPGHITNRDDLRKWVEGFLKRDTGT